MEFGVRMDAESGGDAVGANVPTLSQVSHDGQVFVDGHKPTVNLHRVYSGVNIGGQMGVERGRVSAEPEERSSIDDLGGRSSG